MRYTDSLSRNALFYLPDILIALAIISFWFNVPLIACVLWFATDVTAFSVKRADGKGEVGLIAVISSICLAKYYYYDSFSIIIHAVAVGLTVSLYLLKLPGFYSKPFWNQARFSKECAPFSRSFYWQHGFIAFLFLILFHKPALTLSDWVIISYWTLVCLIAVIITLIAAGILVGYVKVDIKFPPTTFFWCVHNLLFVCIAEETLFRGYIQSYLMNVFSGLYWGDYFALLMASIGFGLLHYQGGLMYVLLAFVAGLFYGFAYLKTGRIEASILCHFGLNLFHFLFFSYPYYQPRETQSNTI